MTTKINKCMSCQGHGGRCICENQPAKPTPHPHAELIKQWADNPNIKIQVKHKLMGMDNWVDCDLQPQWNRACEYRIKPEPKPDIVRYCRIPDKEEYAIPRISESSSISAFDVAANIKLTFDGETGKLKKAEVL